MSRATEWAKTARAAVAAQPKFMCVTFDPYADGEGKNAPSEAIIIATVKPEVRLALSSALIDAADARALARWIFETFGETETT